MSENKNVLTSQQFRDLYDAKNRKGIKELIKKLYTDHYQVFCRYILPTKEKSYIFWFLTSSSFVMKEIILDATKFHNYHLFHELRSTYGFNLKPMAYLADDDVTARSIMMGTVPYEKLSFATMHWRDLLTKILTK
jgi:hypothetical protein